MTFFAFRGSGGLTMHLDRRCASQLEGYFGGTEGLQLLTQRKWATGR